MRININENMPVHHGRTAKQNSLTFPIFEIWLPCISQTLYPGEKQRANDKCKLII